MDLVGGDDGSPAIVMPDGKQLDHAALRHAVDAFAARLRAVGLSRGDRVAILLPQGVELAACVLGAMRAAIAAPLNIAMHPDERSALLRRLRPAAVVTGRSALPGFSVPTGVRHLTPVSDDLVTWRADGDEIAPVPVDSPVAEDLALVLHTSGTTGTPKLAALTHGNLAASVKTIRHWFGLTEIDRALTVMPLHHIHGIVAGLLAPISAGGAVVLPPGFDAFRFFRWLERHGPTWYTAVPAIHQAVVARAPSSATGRLRFVRSSSAPLAPALMHDLEGVFGSPVIETLGMTEAAHQVAANPLPPGTRKPGSVGVPTGTEIEIRETEGWPAGEGEVVVRGPGVFDGYEGVPGSVVDGWFRTGDIGRFDEDGYLFLTGRTKEMINRAGEKIAPREVEEVLLGHPAVAESAVFPVADALLGEAVAAAVVLIPGQSATERDLIRFSRSRLTRSKVPVVVFITESLPRGSTGKVQRRSLAAALGLEPPR